MRTLNFTVNQGQRPPSVQLLNRQHLLERQVLWIWVTIKERLSNSTEINRASKHTAKLVYFFKSLYLLIKFVFGSDNMRKSVTFRNVVWLLSCPCCLEKTEGCLWLCCGFKGLLQSNYTLHINIFFSLLLVVFNHADSSGYICPGFEIYSHLG